MALTSRVYGEPRTGILANLARTTTSSSKKKKWGDGYAAGCSSPDMDCEQIARDDPKGVKAEEYCNGKKAATSKKGWITSLMAGMCEWRCLTGYARCLSEVPLYEDYVNSGGSGRDEA